MNTKELYEMATLDMSGCLDESERREFERAFAMASPEIQAQIRREQLRFADQEEMLPDVQPPASLRARVVQAVREAMATPEEEPVGAIGPSSERNMRLLRQAPFWRAACFALATACAVLAFFVVNVNRQSNDIASMLENNEFNQQMMEDLSPHITNVLFAPDMQQMAFVPTAPDADVVIPEAKMFVDPDRRLGHIILRNLPEIQGQYTVRFLDPEGRIVEDIEFVNTGGVVPVHLGRIRQDVTYSNCEIAAPRGEGGRERVILRAGDM